MQKEGRDEHRLLGFLTGLNSKDATITQEISSAENQLDVLWMSYC